MKSRTLLAVLLLVHLLAHPAMHAFVSDTTAEHPLVSAGGDDPSRARPEGPSCYVCRTAHALFAPTATQGIFLAAVADAPGVSADATPPVVCRAAVPARAPPVS